jgi:hypothetical protein
MLFPPGRRGARPGAASRLLALPTLMTLYTFASCHGIVCFARMIALLRSPTLVREELGTRLSARADVGQVLLTLPLNVMTTRSPAGSSTRCTSPLKSMADMLETQSQPRSSSARS